NSTAASPSASSRIRCRILPAISIKDPFMLRKILVLAFACAAIGLHAQSGAKKGEWPAYGGDTGNTRYSPLDQINAANFSSLVVAWRFKTDHLGPRPEYQYETTP